MSRSSDSGCIDEEILSNEAFGDEGGVLSGVCIPPKPVSWKELLRPIAGGPPLREFLLFTQDFFAISGHTTSCLIRSAVDRSIDGEKPIHPKGEGRTVISGIECGTSLCGDEGECDGEVRPGDDVVGDKSCDRLRFGWTVGSTLPERPFVSIMYSENRGGRDDSQPCAANILAVRSKSDSLTKRKSV